MGRGLPGGRPHARSAPRGSSLPRRPSRSAPIPGSGRAGTERWPLPAQPRAAAAPPGQRLHGSRRLPFKPARLRSARCRQRLAAGRGRQEPFAAAAQPRPLPCQRLERRRVICTKELAGAVAKLFNNGNSTCRCPAPAVGARRRDVAAAAAPAERSLCNPPPAALPAPPPYLPETLLGRWGAPGQRKPTVLLTLHPLNILF